MTVPAPEILLLHAYDARNRGDGLLVEESLELLSRAGVDSRRCQVVAMRADSFAGMGPTMQYPGVGSEGMARLPGAASVAGMALGGMTRARLLRSSRLGRAAQRASLLVGVGGGYLRTAGGRRSIETMAFHLPQLALAAATDTPAIYLPQSVGPLRGAIGDAIKRLLPSLEWLAARDDRSLAVVPDGCQVVRVPDLAVLAAARSLDDGLQPGHGNRAIVIARDLPDDGHYRSSLRLLHDLLPADWAVHSRALGQDDSVFYDSIGVAPGGTSKDLLERSDAGVVVSVRLHGALQSILAGVPAIHLSYERKGFGAYSDLGITEWMHEATSFDAGVVAAQARALIQDPSPYWQRIDDRLSALVEADSLLVDRVRRTLSQTGSFAPSI
jgi:polysaccharide pyruvyl transferase WcaK-like protein